MAGVIKKPRPLSHVSLRGQDVKVICSYLYRKSFRHNSNSSKPNNFHQSGLTTGYLLPDGFSVIATVQREVASKGKMHVKLVWFCFAWICFVF